MDDLHILDEVTEEIAEVERELEKLRYATPFNETHAAKLAWRREVLERNLKRLQELA